MDVGRSALKRSGPVLDIFPACGLNVIRSTHFSYSSETPVSRGLLDLGDSVCQLIPIFYTVSRNVRIMLVSLLKSSSTASICDLSYNPRARLWVVRMSWDSHEWVLRNPCWESCRILHVQFKVCHDLCSICQTMMCLTSFTDRLIRTFVVFMVFYQFVELLRTQTTGFLLCLRSLWWRGQFRFEFHFIPISTL